MALIAPVKSALKDFKIPSAGTHLARIDQIIDLGVHTTTYKDKQGNNKQAHKVLIRFEMPSQKMDDGSPMVISKDFNLSLGTLDGKYKSSLRECIESILGRELTKEEVENFDIESLIGTPVMLQVVHVPGVKDPTKKYAQITGMMKVIDGITIPDPINKPLVFSLSNFNQEIYALLPEWLQKKIALPAGINLAANDENSDPSSLLA